MQAATSEVHDSDSISSLLDEIAESRDRLQRSIDETKSELQRFLANWQLFEESKRQHNQYWALWEDFESEFVPKNKAEQIGPISKLTRREVEVLRLIAEGKSTKQIASYLNISFKTAVSHRSHILEKTNCHESASLVRLAIRAGLVV
jgi:DNA-binding NarL/FixJ family response regulator